MGQASKLARAASMSLAATGATQARIKVLSSLFSPPRACLSTLVLPPPERAQARGGVSGLGRLSRICAAAASPAAAARGRARAAPITLTLTLTLTPFVTLTLTLALTPTPTLTLTLTPTLALALALALTLTLALALTRCPNQVP